MIEQRRHGYRDHQIAMMPLERDDRWTRADTIVAIRAGLLMASAAVVCLLVMWAVWP